MREIGKENPLEDVQGEEARDTAKSGWRRRILKVADEQPSKGRIF